MRKTLIKLLAGLTVFGAVAASASSLGTLTPDSLGATDATVAACDTDGLTTSYNSTWDATDKRYEVTTVTVGGVADACDGQTLKVTVADGTGVSLADGTVTIPTGTGVSHGVTLSSGVSTSAVQKLHVSIS